MARQQQQDPTQQETDKRLGILNALLTCPHRKLDQINEVHQQMIAEDPLFYMRLASWHADRGEVRDHNEAFITNLCLSNFDGHRDVGLALLRNLPPYQTLRVVDFIHGKKIKVWPKRPKNQPKPAEGQVAVKVEPKIEDFGLGKSVPVSMQTEITRYLREREEDHDWFDGCVLTARSTMKRLYALLHIKPSPRAQKILFENNPPEGSRLLALKELAKAKTPAEQAKAIIDNKIPFKIATTVVSAMSPTALLAIVEVMSPQELVNSMGMLQRHGALDNLEIKEIVDQKLEKAKKGKRVNALKVQEAVKAAGVDQTTADKLMAIGDAQIKAKGKIKKDTALFVDKSGSMSTAIEVGKRVAAMVSAIAEGKFFVYAHDNMPYPIEAKGVSLGDWEKALSGIRAGGGTSCGCPLRMMALKNQEVSQIVIVSDGGDNGAPLFHNEYQEYAKRFNIKPNVVFVHVPGSDRNVLTQNCKNTGIEIETWEFNGDYVSLPQLIPMLSGKSGKLDLLMEIQMWPLPARRSA